MGLDIAELVLEIEERYAIELDGDDWVNICTFGDVIDMVKRKNSNRLRNGIWETVCYCTSLSFSVCRKNIISSNNCELRRRRCSVSSSNDMRTA